MSVKIKWVDGMKFVGNADSGHSVVMDAGPEVGGEDTATRPMELCLISLLGCTGMDVVAILRKMEVEWDNFEVSILEYERAPKHPKVYTKIRLLFKITGENIDEKLFAKAIKLSHEKYCSISAMLSKTAEVSYEYKIENKK
jgi:putative redox protein